MAAPTRRPCSRQWAITPPKRLARPSQVRRGGADGILITAGALSLQPDPQYGSVQPPTGCAWRRHHPVSVRPQPTAIERMRTWRLSALIQRFLARNVFWMNTPPSMSQGFCHGKLITFRNSPLRFAPADKLSKLTTVLEF